MRILAIVAALLPWVPASLQAQYRSWEDVCDGASPLPEKVFAAYAPCPMSCVPVIRCERNHGGVFGDVPGALLTDSLIAAGISEAYIQVRTPDGDLVPARFVAEIDGDESGPGIVPFVPE